MKKVEPLIALELPAEPHSAKVARDAIAGLDGHLGSVFGDVVLLISELVTNSVRHAGLDATQPLQLSRGGRRATPCASRCATRARASGRRRRRPIRATWAAGGSCWWISWRSSWGVEHDGEANVVWCELRRR